MNLTFSKKNTLPALLLIVALISVWRLGSIDLQEWDESRNGVNAFEMLQNNDFINLHYNNSPDTWNAKPPLFIWTVAISYQIFGYNEFALRFPSFVCLIIFFIYCFKIIETLEKQIKAIICCLILLASKAVLGYHIGLSGDFDMMLTAFLTASVYYFIQYTEKEKQNAIFGLAVFSGLAFYTKGTASFIFFPGFFLYLIIQGKLLKFIKDIRVWLSLGLFLAIIFSWIFLIIHFGKTPNQTHYGSLNAIETMFFHDTYRRITDSNFENGIMAASKLFFIQAIDVRLNLWNYLFYLGIILGAKEIFFLRKNLISTFQNEKYKLTVLSVCLILPISIVLTFSKNQHDWYLAPVYMFVAFIITQVIYFVCTKWNQAIWIFSILFLFTFSRQLTFIFNSSSEKHNFFVNNNLLKNKDIVINKSIKQDFNLYLKWLNVKQVNHEKINESLSAHGKFILYESSEKLSIKVKSIKEISGYTLAKIVD